MLFDASQGLDFTLALEKKCLAFRLMKKRGILKEELRPCDPERAYRLVSGKRNVMGESDDWKEEWFERCMLSWIKGKH